MDNKKHYCYMLRCADGTIYTGYTTDPARREEEHNSPKGGAKYTKTRQPVKMVYVEEFDTKQEAMSREYFIKHHLTREQKEELIRSSQGIENLQKEFIEKYGAVKGLQMAAVVLPNVTKDFEEMLKKAPAGAIVKEEYLFDDIKGGIRMEGSDGKIRKCELL